MTQHQGSRKLHIDRVGKKISIMKKIVFFLSLLLFVVKSFSQSPSNLTFSKNYYLQESKSQKTIAWVFLGGGAGIAAFGVFAELLRDAQDEPGFTGGWIAIGGGVLALSSIPFFISSSKNKKKAAAVTINYQNIYLPQQNSVVLKAQPTISLKIGL